MYNSHRFHLTPNMDFLKKDPNSSMYSKKEADKVVVTRKKMPKVSEEERLHRSIQNGSITDRDVQIIQKSGGTLYRELVQASDRKRKELSHHEIARYGKDFDGIDSRGNWYKDIKIEDFFKGER